MAQKQQTGQRLRQSPAKMLLSTMIQSSDLELEQMIRRETESNVALEMVDPREEGYDRGEADDYAAGEGSDDAYDYPASDPAAADADGALSDAERGDKIEIERDDDDVIDTSSVQQASDETDGRDIFANTMSEQTFRDDLKQQIDVLPISDEERFLAHYLIDCLEDDGYLRRPLDELVDDLEFAQHHTTTEEDLEAVLVEIVQEELEPTGIGARDLRECLLLQAQELKATPANRMAYMVLDLAFDDLVEKHYDSIQERFGITNHRAWVDVMHAIRRLNPKPGNMQPVTSKSADAIKERIRPDFFVRNEEGQLVVTLNDGQLPEVRISAEEQSLLDSLQSEPSGGTPHPSAADQERKEGVRFMQQSIQRAQTFIDCIAQRRTTLLSVMQTLVSLQRAYFLTGQVETLRPMTLEDVERACGYDKSTISRVTSAKYADTEFGIIALKSLFSNAVGDTTQTAIIDALREVIEAEDKRHPLTDEALMAQLKKQGYDISRRTVAKYRMILGIGSTKERGEN